jgi:hypothetical protein
MRFDSKVDDEGCDPALPSPPRVPPTRANNYEKKRAFEKMPDARGGRIDAGSLTDRFEGKGR